jgi:hypothetical protein
MTKKMTALALAFALPALASAGDLNPGALQLSGKSSFELGKKTTDVGGVKTDETRVDGGISAMYYISQFLAFGLEADYRSQKVDSGPKSSEFLFGPKAGLDYELMRHFSAFADGAVGIVQAEEGGETATGVGLRIAGGFRLFFNPNVSFDLFGAYTRTQAKFATLGTKTTDDLIAGVGLSVYLTNNPANSEGYQPPPREYR